MAQKRTTSEGWYQEWGKPTQGLTPGTVATILAGIKHCHVARADSCSSHLAVEVPSEDASNE